MKLQFWGVRGSVPTPGLEYLRYGGNTCCTAITGAAGEFIVFDAGTGFCQLGDALLEESFGRGQGEMVLLLSHTHWDHILGFPFPAIIHLPGNTFIIYGPDTTQGSLERVCDGLFSPVYSPLFSITNTNASQHFYTISTEPFLVGNIRIQAQPFPHSNQTTTWAYRLTEEQQSLVYITDIHYTSQEVMQEAVTFARGADILIHGAHYTQAELNDEIQRHCSIEDAIDVAQMAHVPTLLLFHHAPTRTDDQLDTLLEQYRAMLQQRHSSLYIDAACEGSIIEIRAS